MEGKRERELTYAVWDLIPPTFRCVCMVHRNSNASPLVPDSGPLHIVVEVMEIG